MAYPRENMQLTAAKGSAAEKEVKVETKQAEENRRLRIAQILASLSNATAASGLVTVEDGTSSWFFFVTTGQVVDIEPEWQCAPGAKVTVKLAAVAGATGTLAVFYTAE